MSKKPVANKVSYEPFQVLGTRRRDLQIFAGSFHLAIHPINTLPQKFYIGREPKITLIAGGIPHDDVRLFQVRLPEFDQYVLRIMDVQLLCHRSPYPADHLKICKFFCPQEDPTEHLPLDVPVELFINPAV